MPLVPRRTAIVRREVQDRTDAQVIAANVDTVFLVTSCNQDFNVRRIERTLTVLWESGAQPVLVLNKSDLASDPQRLSDDAEAVAPGVAVHVVSATTGKDLASLSRYLCPGRTVALVGSSGVGKSTLINRFSGRQMLAVQEVRASDARGRHTTTSRQLVKLDSGALLIDTPGLREIGLWETQDGLAEAFADIDALAAECRYSDCEHESEPGCAVKAAIEGHSLDPERLASYRKLERELAFLERRKDEWAQREQKRRWKRIHRAFRKTQRR